MPQTLSNQKAKADVELMMVLQIFFLEFLKTPRAFLSGRSDLMNPLAFTAFKKLRDQRKLKVSALPAAHRSIEKSISRKFQGLHRRAFIQVPLFNFEKNCEVLVLDHVSKNFYVDREEIQKDFFFNDRQVSDDGTQASASSSAIFDHYFENQLMDIEKLNRLGKTTTFGFRFRRSNMKKIKKGELSFSHNLHLRYSESKDAEDQSEYLFDSFSPKVLVICGKSQLAKNKDKHNEQLRSTIGKSKEFNIVHKSIQSSKTLTLKKDDLKKIEKNYLDLDVLYALEHIRNLKTSGDSFSTLNPILITKFLEGQTKFREIPEEHFTISLYRNYNHFETAKYDSMSGLDSNHFRQDKFGNSFLLLPVGNREHSSLVLVSTLTGLGIGVLAIIYFMMRKIK